MTSLISQELLVKDDPDAVSERMVSLNPAIAHLLPQDLCRKHAVIPYQYSDGVLTLVAASPVSRRAEDDVREETGYEPAWLTADRAEIEGAIDRLFAENGQAKTGFTADDLLGHGLAMPPRLGETLAQRGLVTEAQLGEAIVEQRRTGDRIGEVLVHGGAIDERALLRVMAERLDLPTVDLSEFDPATAPRDVIPEPMERRLGCVPIALDSDNVYLAVSDDLGDRVREVGDYTSRRVHQFLAPGSEIEDLQRKIHGEVYTDIALYDLQDRYPESSAHIVLSGVQKGAIAILAIILIAFLIWKPVGTLIVLFAMASIFYTATSLYKLVAGYSALRHRYNVDTSPESLAAMDERNLPIYTILVPLFREASVIPYLVAGIEGLDYPKTKLDVRLLCEQEDEETIAAIRNLNLPPHFTLVIVPPSQPQTKPKACNYGLLGAKGEYVVIYDAEDRPDPHQLKKAALMFENSDDSVVCIQAKLNFFNQDTNILTRWFSVEYAMLFDLVLPGLDARNDPIPLGGTSNHIRMDRLIEVGGWDPFNVTEDADLGVRLHQAGYRTTMMDSTTFEEANVSVGNWVRQRSRWIKGYIQTWLVYMRNPFRLLKNVGFKGFMSFQLLIGGTFIFLINPFFWFLTTLFALTQAGFIQELFPGWVYFLAAAQLFLGNFVFTYLGLSAAVRRGDDRLAPYALFFPFYWGLMSVAAWKGFSQLFTNPFFWEKTEHGLDLGGSIDRGTGPQKAVGR